MTFAQRHHISKAALKDLLELTSLHLRKPNKFPTSVKKLQSLISLKSSLKKHYFCQSCYGLLENEKTEFCNNDKCKANTDKKGHFVYADVDDELKTIFKSK